MALRTTVTELLGIDHPVVLGGMGSGATGHALVAAVSAPAAWARSAPASWTRRRNAPKSTPSARKQTGPSA